MASGPAVYDELMASYDIPDNVALLDLGCLSLAMIDRVREFDVILTVDAVDDSGEPAGTVLRYAPDAMARHVGITASLHDLKLIDLFDSAALLGYQAEACVWVCRWKTLLLPKRPKGLPGLCMMRCRCW